MLRAIKRRLLLRTRWNLFRELADAIGVRAALQLRIKPSLKQQGEYSIHPRQVQYPLLIRRNSSDPKVFRQIFIEQEYQCLDSLPNVGLVIDCGANVGYSSAYFLSTFPNCQLISVEPDPNNFALLKRNLKPYGKRANLIQAGVWCRHTGLKISECQYRDGLQWSTQVEERTANEVGTLEGVTIESLLLSSAYDRISLLKMDVEGAEAVIFSENYKPWLDRVDAIAIELHDDSLFGRGSDVFLAAINTHNFQIAQSGELTICRRP